MRLGPGFAPRSAARHMAEATSVRSYVFLWCAPCGPLSSGGTTTRSTSTTAAWCPDRRTPTRSLLPSCYHHVPLALIMVGDPRTRPALSVFGCPCYDNLCS